MGVNHIILHVVKRPKDFFFGIKVALKRRDLTFVDIILDEKYYNLVDDAEYSKVILYSKASELKILKRLFNYRIVFAEIERLCEETVALNKNLHKMFYFYLADEGVWGELMQVIKAKLTKKYQINIILVNVQHGFFTLEKPKVSPLRSVVNTIFKPLMGGYPLLGKGFGGAGFDVYFVFGKLEKRYLERRNPKSLVIKSPVICKYELIEKVSNITKKVKSNTLNILFAAQLNEINPDCLFSEEEVTKRLSTLFKVLKRSGFRIYYRLHPAISDKERYLNYLKQFGVYEDVIIANNHSLEYYLSIVGSVLSLQSTTLIDGYLVGRMPILIKGLTKDFSFTIPHEIIDLDQELEREVIHAFNNIGQYYREEVNFMLEKEAEDFFNKL